MDRKLRQSLVRPRHLVATLLVTLLLGGFGLGITAATQPTKTSPALSAPFGVPAPRIGDHAVYTTSSPSDASYPTQVEFQWLNDTVSFNGTGARVVVNQLLVATHYANPDQDLLETITLLPGTGLQAAFAWDQSWNSTSAGFFPVPGSNSTNENHVRAWNFQERAASIWCGIRNDLQGAKVDLSRDIPVLAHCVHGAGSWIVDSYAMNATEVLQGPRVRMVTFRVFYDYQNNTREFMTWSFREDLAYPVNMTFDQGPQYELTAFMPGTKPIAAESWTIAPAPPAVVMGKRQVWGPDETGIVHPFPASMAFQQARDDANWPDLRNFLAKHPQAYVGAAGYWEDVYEFSQRSWTMVVTDGVAKFPFSVSNNYLQGESLQGLPPVKSYYRTDVSWGKDEVYPAPVDAPAQMPTVASLMTGWASLAQANRTDANEWKWDLGKYCVQPDDCRINDNYMGTGRITDTVSGLGGMPVVGIKRDLAYKEAFVNHTFVYSSFVEETMNQHPDFSPLGSAGSASPAKAQGFQPLASYSHGTFAWIATPQAAAAGFLAILVGALYWLWPALKAGPAVLFSRVREEDVLKNALRAEIHQRIEAEPGIHHQALVRAVARGHGAVEHHIRKLVEAGLVNRAQGKGYTCYFPKGRVDYRAMAAAPLLKSPVARSILEQVRQNPGIRSIELARALAVAPATVHYHVERMRNAGLLEGSLSGGALRLHALGPVDAKGIVSA